MTNLTVKQANALIDAINAEARVGGTISAISGDFVSGGTIQLNASYDVILNAISQVLTKTFFAVRPYTPKFAGLELDGQAFGNMSRKLSIADSNFKDGEFNIPADGSSVDAYKVKRANILQENFYGENNWTFQSPTQFKNQLDIAFSSAEELVRFWAMITQSTLDQIAQAKENLRRAMLANYIGAKYAANSASIESGNIVNLVTAYNTATGQSLTLAQIRKDKYNDFMKFCYATIKSYSDKLTERTQKFHTNITGKEISRHTPKEMQRLYMYSPELNSMEANVLADTFNKDLVTFADYEAVNFWQNIDDPMKIKVYPTYLQKNGLLKEVKDTAVTGKYTLVLGGTIASGDKIKIDGVECASTGTTLSAFATVIAGKTFTNYNATASGDTVTFTEKSGKEGAGVPVIENAVAGLTAVVATVTPGVTGGAITVDNIFAVLMDKDVMGVTPVSEYVLATPMNADGAYTNFFYHSTYRYITSFTENGVVFLLA